MKVPSIYRFGILIVLCVTSWAAAQRMVSSLADNIIIPQSRPLAFRIRPDIKPVQITGVKATVALSGQVAITTLDVSLKNDTGRRQEAEVIMPVPNGAVVQGFTFEGAGKEPTAQILPAEEARRIYNQIVAQVRDPALLEFIGYNLIRSSVFPVEPNGTQTIRLTYEHIVTVDGNRYDYVLPRSESLENNIPWDIEVTIKGDKPISTVYSASHSLELDRKSADKMIVTLKKSSRTDPGAFRLSYLVEGQAITASLICYPDPEIGGGYFLLLAGLPAELSQADRSAIKREVTLVIDRSGSMRGQKLEQTKEVASQIIDALETDEAFNIITYQNVAEAFSDTPLMCNRKNVRAAWDFIDAIRPVGGTNIYDALNEALRQKPQGDRLGLVLFLTDGLPTVGKTRETDIRALVADYNPYKRRVFSFGVGVDVNAPLLDKIAELSRATSCYVLPEEDVEVKVGQVFKRLAGPVFAEPVLKVRDREGDKAPGRTADILPAAIPDLFDGDQLVLLGKYIGDDPLSFQFKGNLLGQKRSFNFTFNLDQASTRNAFVPRLWAARKIAELIDAVRQAGGDNGTDISDLKIKELIDEIVRLSTEHGILTEYTSFLAREGSVIDDYAAVLGEAEVMLHNRAMRPRSGLESINQSYNLGAQKHASKLNYDNSYLDIEMKDVTFDTVQQINDRAYFKNRGQWMEGRLINQPERQKADRTIEFGTDEFFELAGKLASQNRQGSIALRGEILLEMEGQIILIRNPQ